MGDIYRLISELYATMSKKHKRIADYLLNNTDIAPFLTVKELANATEVSDATVMRFASILGYSGYLEMQKDIKRSAQKRLTTSERLNLTNERSDDMFQDISAVFLNDIERMKRTLQQLDIVAMEEAATLLFESRNVFIVADRSAHSLACFLKYYLDIIRDHVSTVTNTRIDFLNTLSTQDVVICISFLRYSQSTVDIFEYANKHAKTITITDHLSSPLVPSSTVCLRCVSEMTSFIDSLTAPMCLLHSLINITAQKHGNALYQRMQSLEQIWSEFHIFYDNK